MRVSAYHEIAEEAGEEKPGQREAYLRIMHALGDLIHIPETEDSGGKLKDKVINIHWARKAMYRLLTSTLVKKFKGVLTWEQWIQIPDGDRSDLLVEVMKAQRVLYEIRKTEMQTGSQKIRWLLPDMLPDSEEPHPWAKETPAQSREFELFLPESVFLRFLGENREWIRRTGDAFRDEVLLTNGQGTQALVRPDYESEKHAIHFYADPANLEESQKWCAALYAKLTGELPPEKKLAARKKLVDAGEKLEHLRKRAEVYVKKTGFRGTRFMLQILLGPRCKQTNLWKAINGSTILEGAIVKRKPKSRGSHNYSQLSEAHLNTIPAREEQRATGENLVEILLADKDKEQIIDEIMDLQEKASDYTKQELQAYRGSLVTKTREELAPALIFLQKYSGSLD